MKDETEIRDGWAGLEDDPFERSTEEVVDAVQEAQQTAAERAAVEGSDSPELQAAKLAAEESQKTYEELEAAERKAKLIATYRELPEAQRDGWTTTALRGMNTEAFLKEVAEVERQEQVQELMGKDEDALLKGYRAGDLDLQAAIEEALQDDPDRLRMIATRREEHVVAAPAAEPAAEGEEVKPTDWRAVLAESDVGPGMPTPEDRERYVAQERVAIEKGQIQVTAELRQELADTIAYADSFPENHPRRIEAIEEAAGILAFAKAEHLASIPFGLGGIEQSTSFQKPDGSHWLREKDGRGAIRETPIEGGQAPSELYEDVGPPEPIDPKDVKTLDDAARLTNEQWMELDRRDPERKEMLLRLASERQEQLHREARAGGAL